MRPLLAFLVVSLFGMLVLYGFVSVDFDVDKTSSEYFIEHTHEEVGSENIVTGIYLDYRLFDSIFEAGILLVSVAGIIFMSKKDDDMFKEDKYEKK